MDARVQARRVFIAMARKRQQPGSGSAPAFLRERTADMRFPDLRHVLEGIPWAVVGAAATRLYMPERATLDLDILVVSRDRSAAEERLAAAGYVYQGGLTIGGSSWTSPEGFPLDVLDCRAGWCAPALAGAAANPDAQGLPILPLPYLVLMKFQAGRVQDLADVTRMLGQASAEPLEQVRAVFRQHLPDDADDLESLILLGQMELP